MRVRRKVGRGAATAVECAFILPITLFLLFGLVVGSMGVFRYQEVATLARAGARYGSTHGHQDRTDAAPPAVAARSQDRAATAGGAAGGNVMIRLLPKNTRGRRGVVALFVAFCLVALIGVVAISVDGGLIYLEQRRAQATADAAAM